MNSPGQNPLMRDLWMQDSESGIQTGHRPAGFTANRKCTIAGFRTGCGHLDGKSAVITGSEVHRGPVWPWRSDPEQLMRIYIETGRRQMRSIRVR